MTQLIHVGVLGMHWGIRRNRRPVSTSEDHKISRAIKAKRIDEMSNEELKKLTSRLQLEKQLKDLNKGDISFGQKVVGGLLTNVSNQVVSALTSIAVKKISAAISDKLGVKD